MTAAHLQGRPTFVRSETIVSARVRTRQHPAIAQASDCRLIQTYATHPQAPYETSV